MAIGDTLETARSLSAAPDEVLAENGTSDLCAFAELYRRYREPIHRFLSNRTRDAATAEDLTAQVFVKALRAGDSFRGDGSYRRWLHQIARNTLTNWQAEKTRLQIPVATVPDLSAEEDSPTVTTLANEERDMIREVVQELPEAQREVVHLRYWRDLTIDEIARLTGRTTGAIRVLLHRARRSLSNRLNLKDMTAILGATGAAASIAIYSVHRQKRRKQ